MKPIKFRMWAYPENEMVYWGDKGQRNQEMCEFIASGGDSSIPNDDGTPCGVRLMQFTGLLDKNKKEIYEGDILDVGGGRGMVVSYSNGMNDCLGMNVGWFVEQDDFARWDELKYEDYYEVIGNIYENKDLL